jgi:acetyltransferase
MGQYNLNRIFKPRHVAVVGASEKAGTIGNALMRNLIDGEFPGTLLPVNPNIKPQRQFCVRDARGRKSGLCIPERCHL